MADLKTKKKQLGEKCIFYTLLFLFCIYCKYIIHLVIINLVSIHSHPEKVVFKSANTIIKASPHKILRDHIQYYYLPSWKIWQTILRLLDSTRPQ